MNGAWRLVNLRTVQYHWYKCPSCGIRRANDSSIGHQISKSMDPDIQCFRKQVSNTGTKVRQSELHFQVINKLDVGFQNYWRLKPKTSKRVRCYCIPAAHNERPHLPPQTLTSLSAQWTRCKITTTTITQFPETAAWFSVLAHERLSIIRSKHMKKRTPRNQ